MIQKKDCQLASLAVLVSLVLCGGILTFEMGLARTPYETADSLGRKMGFNDPFSLEHYGIMLTHFHLKAMFRSEAIYTWVLLLAHVFGFVVIAGITKPERVWTRWYFAIQFLIFPLGLIGLFFLPYFTWHIFAGYLDREGVVDFPLAILLAQPIWFICSASAFFLLRAGLRRSGKPSANRPS